MAIADEITRRLESAFRPTRLVVTDDSEAHRGHGGWREGGETHFRVEIAADALGPLSRVERHRAIHQAIGPELVAQIHALEIRIEA
ncbi:BolA family transcriptional regulator [Meridianimarinicoccus roseus]|jgi:BolA protein|uniref:BolA family transcriptional regulator n=1 Tax=Meridianimarinicoccus roseus TaxID=2072018 RepID=A0A2V2L8J8_9RHOB|nr:BolA family protein [Meridianimarinicoccus roseus]PWR01748.1 BolA family transcriptional regulator [Meridianimarinicoccus roseus]